LVLKDIYGVAGQSSITVTTQGSDVFENGATQLVINTKFGNLTFYAGSAGKWYILNGTQMANAAIDSLSTGQLYVSSIVGPALRNLVSTANLSNLVSTTYLASQLTSTVIGLGTAGYASTQTVGALLSSLSSSYGVSFTTSSFSAQVAAISSLQVDSIQIGNGVGWINLGPIQTLAVSTQQLQAGIVYATNVSTALINGDFPVTQSNIVSTVIGLGTAGYLSSITDVSVSGVVSTANLANLVSTSYLTSQLTSTVIGLGSAGYISSLSTVTLSTGTLIARTVAITDVNTNNQNLLTTSSGVLLLNNLAVGGGGGGGGSGMTISDYVVACRLSADQDLTADIDNDIQFKDDFDPQSWWNSSTYRFTPNIAGYYLVSYQVWFNFVDVIFNILLLILRHFYQNLSCFESLTS
jgi:hypothetical protein